MTDARVSQLFVEEWVTVTPPSLRVSTVFLEVIADPTTIPPSVRVTTEFLEVIADPQPQSVGGGFIMLGM